MTELTGQLVEVCESHPRERVWVRNGETLEQAIERQIQEDAEKDLSVDGLDCEA